jgi:hypothetical protein
MTVPMISSYDEGPVSPELVLVDPALRMQLEMREPIVPGEALHPAAEVLAPADGSKAPIVSSPNTGSVGDAPLLAEPVARADNAGHVPTRSTALRLLMMVAVAAALSATAGSGVFVGLLLSGDRASVFGVAATTPPPPPRPPQAAATTTAKPASPTVSTQPIVSQATTTPTVAAQAGIRASASSRVFAWAPVANATGYTVEISRNGESVFSATTSAPHVSVPSHWRHAGRNMTLSPGTYQWHVWPVVRSGTTTETSTTAIVASNLEITP